MGQPEEQHDQQNTAQSEGEIPPSEQDANTIGQAALPMNWLTSLAFKVKKTPNIITISHMSNRPAQRRQKILTQIEKSNIRKTSNTVRSEAPGTIPEQLLLTLNHSVKGKSHAQCLIGR